MVRYDGSSPVLGPGVMEAHSIDGGCFWGTYSLGNKKENLVTAPYIIPLCFGAREAKLNSGFQVF